MRLNTTVRHKVSAVDEQHIVRIAAVLAEWNPLGARAASMPDLDGYRTEVIDLIMALGWRGKQVAPATTVSHVLNQAFDLELAPIDCASAANEILSILKDAR